MTGTDDRRPPEVPARVGAALRRPETWAAVPPDLQQTVLAKLRSQRDSTGPLTTLPSQAEAPTTEEQVARHRRAARPPRVAAKPSRYASRPRRYGAKPARPGRKVLAALAAAAAFLVVVTGIVLMRQGDDGLHATLAATELAPNASGKAEFRDTPSGFEITLDVTGLPVPAPDTFYQAWLRNADGDVVAIGTFHARQGGDDIVLWSGVDPKDFPTMTVTLQRVADGPPSSGKVYLRGNISEGD